MKQATPPSPNLSVALLWRGAVIQEETFGPTGARQVRVGSQGDLAVVADALPRDFTMFERAPHGLLLRLTQALKGDLTRHGEDLDLGDARLGAAALGQVNTDLGPQQVLELALESGDRGLLRVGQDTQVFFHVFDALPKAPTRGLLGAVDVGGALGALIAASAVCHLLFVLFAFLSYDPEANLNPLFAQNRFASFVVAELNDPVEEPLIEAPEEDTTGKRAANEEGKFGAEDSELEDSKIPKNQGEMAKEIDVKNIGVNKALGSKLLGGGPLKSIFGNQEGFDAGMNVAMSGTGTELAVGRGAGGMGLRGTGRGGGGEDGLGRIAGIGSVDSGGGVGKGGAIGRKQKAKVKRKVTTGSPKVGDFCDRKDITRVVRAKTNAVRHCFEKQLQSNPKLSGKIVASWRVGLDGAVSASSIASSTMGNKAVEGCIARVVRRFRFQKPKGGICVIQYPFIFSGLE